MTNNKITSSVRDSLAQKEAPARTEAAKQSVTANHTNDDPLVGWFGLAANVKPTRTYRKSKRGWNRGQS